jgi:aminomethyltransferase
LVAEGRQPPRHDDAVVRAGDRVGTVTSGNFSPVLERGIALALIDTQAEVAEGEDLAFDVRGRQVPCRVTALPFVRAGQRVGPIAGGH